ncbi:hypothetical protein G0R83_004580 [Salmonella enterica]|uniref:Uncharacterized protein n=1 Tax=Salmonella enterica TaxID=28901 RepID=A0A749PLR1_SALER|nr:hypothetical protein [Salmonella enterica]EEI4534623.1 hypothetical protein [Salmonella enterica]EIX3165369.1 hypothetical protein [Salmonella enterica]HAF5759254.1 hypothetical protein [Salmonella enterica]
MGAAFTKLIVCLQLAVRIITGVIHGINQQIYILVFFLEGLQYIYYHESEVRKLQEQHKLWLKKAPYAYITTCGKDEEICVLIDEKQVFL